MYYVNHSKPSRAPLFPAAFSQQWRQWLSKAVSESLRNPRAVRCHRCIGKGSIDLETMHVSEHEPLGKYICDALLSPLCTFVRVK